MTDLVDEGSRGVRAYPTEVSPYQLAFDVSAVDLRLQLLSELLLEMSYYRVRTALNGSRRLSQTKSCSSF